MKRFVAIYLGSATALAQWKATDDQKRRELERAGMDAWMKWAKENEASIVDHGAPLGKTKRINAEAYSDITPDPRGSALQRAATLGAVCRPA